MATNWVCPIDGALPADNGTNQTPTNNQIGASATADVDGNPPHCPICGSAVIAASATLVTAKTGVASGSQHPADIDATYVTAADSPLAQFGATPYTIAGGQPIQPHAYKVVSGHVLRGAQVADEANPFPSTNLVTPETINTVVGP